MQWTVQVLTHTGWQNAHPVGRDSEPFKYNSEAQALENLSRFFPQRVRAFVYGGQPQTVRVHPYQEKV